MAIVLFAMIGASIKAKTAYWICFAIFCLGWLAQQIIYHEKK